MDEQRRSIEAQVISKCVARIAASVSKNENLSPRNESLQYLWDFFAKNIDEYCKKKVKDEETK